jgi:hypothetical protein
MPTHHSDPVLACDTDGCDATAPRPARGQGVQRYKDDHRALYEAGWREAPNPDERPLRLAPHTVIVSCPNCPPVAVY